MRQDKPVKRVRRALQRISRNKYIPGVEIRDICIRWSKMATIRAWTNVYNNAMAMECAVIGMINGKPPAYVDDEDYGDYVKALHANYLHRRDMPELEILHLEIRRHRNGKHVKNSES